MPDELLTIFKLCFLVLLYLFFFRVLRAVWTEVNATQNACAGAAAGPAPAPVPVPVPAPEPSEPKRRRRAKAPAAAATPTGPSHLVAVDPEHLAGIEYTLQDGMTLGRGDATIVLDDGFLSGKHARFDHRDGQWSVADLGSTNGTYVNNVKVDQVTHLDLGDRVQVGNVILEVR